MQMQVQRLHAGRCWGAHNGRRFLKPVPILPSGMRLPCGTGGVAAGGEGISKTEIGPAVPGPVRRVTSDRSFNLNHIPYTGSTLDIHLKLEQQQDDKLTNKSKEFDSDSAGSTAAVPESTRNSKSNSTSKSIALGLMFASWNIFNIYFNIFNKQVLKVYPFPMTVNAMQFGVGSVMILLMWGMKLHKRPKISSLSQLWVIGALAAVHTMGNVFTNMSLLKVAVSFTHTVKAMEPFFSVLLSALFLHQQPSGMAIATLIPIVGGVALASFTEASFNWIGFWSAMASNFANQSRNVVSKKLMTKDEESLDNINLFSLITIISFFISAPLMFLTEGITFTPSYLLASGLNVREIYVRCLLAGVCFHAYQQAGYMLLEHISPVSHSVGNCVKRVVVIVASVLFFRTPISPINSLGTGIALAGVFLYSRVNSIKKKSQ